MRTLYIDCSSLIEHVELNTGIQRVVRQAVRHLQTIAPEHGYKAQPVVISHGRFMAITEDQLYPKAKTPVYEPAEEEEPALEQSSHADDTGLQQYAAAPEGLKRKTLAYLYGVYNGLQALLLGLAGNTEAARNFIFAPRQRFGLNWLVYNSLVAPLKAANSLLTRPQKQAVAAAPSAQSDDSQDNLETANQDAAAASAEPAAKEPKGQDPFSLVKEGDILLLLDSSWHNNIWPSVESIRDNGAKVVAVIYDLIPITHPQFCDAHLVKVFNSWFKDSVGMVDGFVAISDTVRQDVEQFLQQQKPDAFTPEQFDYFWLGTDFKHSDTEEEVRGAIPQHMMERPTYLIVSTIEPRKNHKTVLNAFEQLWQQGREVNLAFVGKPGWKVEKLLTRIRRHPENGKRLFHWQNLSDAELQYCYENARMLIFPSYAEGFGLPIIESLGHGLPVMASDIPIHREVGGERVAYFPVEDEQALAQMVANFEDNGIPDALRVPEDFNWLNWQQATQQLMDKVEKLAK
jgi:alpha-1,2-rhamnosyltransferase